MKKKIIKRKKKSRVAHVIQCFMHLDLTDAVDGPDAVDSGRVRINGQIEFPDAEMPVQMPDQTSAVEQVQRIIIPVAKPADPGIEECGMAAQTGFIGRKTFFDLLQERKSPHCFGFKFVIFRSSGFI